MEPHEEPEVIAPTLPPSPVQVPEPVLPQEDLEPKEQVAYLSDDEDDDPAQDGEQPPSPPQDGSTEVGVPSLPMGWITKVHHKSSCDIPSHHRLIGTLSAYFTDWDPTFEYVCWEHKHHLEATYWKCHVCVFVKDEEMGTYLLDRCFSHRGCRATIEDGIEDAAFEACLGLRHLRYDVMQDDQYRYFPHGDPKQGWIMMNPRNLELIPQVMVDFGHDMMVKNHRMEAMVKALGKDVKRYQEVIDGLRIDQGMEAMYDYLEHKARP
jgi:hypothetical protein